MKSASSRVAPRYARALLGLAEKSQLEAWGAELERFGRVIEAPEIARALESPELSQRARLEAVSTIAARLELSFPVRSFALVVARHGRLSEWSAISRAYRDQLDTMLGRARATLIFTREPAPEQAARVVAGLEAMAGKTIIATFETDPALLGGVVVELEGRTYDGSIAARLEEARRRLVG